MKPSIETGAREVVVGSAEMEKSLGFFSGTVEHLNKVPLAELGAAAIAIAGFKKMVRNSGETK